MLKKGALLATMLLAPTAALAFTVTPDSLTGDTGTGFKTYYDSGAETVTLADLTAKDSSAVMLFENGEYANTNRFGIYGFTKDSNGKIKLENTLEVFNGASSPYKSIGVTWSKDASNVWTVTNNVTGASAQIGTTFGFYLDSNGSSTDRFYSQTALNADNVDHFKVYDTRDHATTDFFGSDVVLGIEDLPGGGDADYDDMVVGVSDVNPVPEPGTMVLLGAGFLGLAIYGKRRRNA